MREHIIESIMYNILLITNPIYHDYGASLLYDGLRKLGHTVQDCPYNYFFHFSELKNCNLDCKNGPCATPSTIGCKSHPAALTLDYQLISENPLDDKFDLIVTNNGIGQEKLHRALAKRNIPMICLDLGDSTNSAYDLWKQVVGSSQFTLFRREYLEGQTGHPLPYSWYDVNSIPIQPTYSISCLYRPTNPLRNTISNEIRQIENSIVGTFSHAEYMDIISHSAFSVALPGAGYDTLRHWEIPAMGSVLCRMPSPIVVPNDFKDGVNCIEFNSVSELREKINRFLHDPIGYNVLRANSLEHFKKFHTTAQRAQYMLDKACH
jgi:hypothetical protein